MKTLQKLFIISAIFSALPTSAQQFSGIITNSNSDAVENARIILQYPDGTPENDTVYSDASGYYVIGEAETVGINNLANTAETFYVRYNGNRFFIDITSGNKLGTGKLFGIDGKLIAQFPLHKTANNHYTGQISLNNQHARLLIFSDGYCSAKFFVLSGSPSAELVEGDNSVAVSVAELVEATLSDNPPSTGSGSEITPVTEYFDNAQQPPVDNSVTELVEVTGFNYFDKLNKRLSLREIDNSYHLLIQTNDTYQPADSSLQNIDPTQSYEYNFQLADWPSFFANLYFNIRGYENADLENATVEVNGNNLSLLELTDAEGNASFTNISIPAYPDNKLLPDTLDITNTAGELTWYKDTLENLKITGSETGKNYNFSYTLSPTENTYIQKLYAEDDAGNPLALSWILTNTDFTQSYASGTTDASGNGQINYNFAYPGEMTDMQLTASKEGYTNDTLHNIAILPGNITTTNITLTEKQGTAYLWRAGMDELEQNGTTFDIIINSLNYSDTLFSVNNMTAWRDTIPVNWFGTTTCTLKYIPYTTEWEVPLYPRTITLEMTNGEQATAVDTLYALEQEQKFYVRVFDFENAGQMKEANVEIRDNQDSVWFSGNTTNGIIETTYIPTGGEGDGFEGVVNVTPLDNSYFGTRMVVTGGDMTGPNEQDLLNIGVNYKGYEYTVPEIQSNFDKTDTISFYLLSKTREDPLHPGEMLTMNNLEIREMEGNSINTEMVRYDVENMFFRDPKPQEYTDYRNHARLIFGYAFGENEVSTERSSSAINDYSIDNDNYKTTLGWNVSFGTSSTNTVGVNPLLFGKANIDSRGEVSYDLTYLAGCAREDARRVGISTVASRTSYMNASLPPSFPDTLNQKDRVYTNLFLHYRKTQLKQDKGVRNMTNLGYLFVPAKQKNVGIKP